MNVLGIETSCDETGLAIYSQAGGLRAHVIQTQIPMHQEYGGVVPELASRDHVRRLIPLTKQVLEKAGLSLKDIHGIAYTRGPGLIGALLVGASFARSLGFALNIPTLGVHHLEAHLVASLLEDNPPEFPFLALLVSGGHTALIAVEKLGTYEMLGETMDDAAGEAFDKTARLLKLGMPGGPNLAKLAKQGDSKRFHFPRPMLNRPGLDFSFSGLKTHALTVIEKESQDKQTQADIARAFEDAIIDTLVTKTKRALEQTGYKKLVVAGGVGANLHLRAQLQQQLGEQHEIYFPRLEFCTDNGAMVALLGALRLSAGEQDGLHIRVQARWLLSDLGVH